MGFLYNELFWKIFLTVLAALGAIAALWEKIGKPMYQTLIRPVASYITMFFAMPGLVRSELTANGGGSIKDLVRKSVEQNELLISKIAVLNTRERTCRAINPNAMFESNMHGQCVWVNRQYIRMVGKSMEEVIGWGWLGGISDRDRDNVRKSWDECVSQGRDFDMLYHMVDSMGKEFSVSCHAHVMKDPDTGKDIGYLGLILEV